MGALGLLALCAGIMVAFQARAMKRTGYAE